MHGPTPPPRFTGTSTSKRPGLGRRLVSALGSSLALFSFVAGKKRRTLSAALALENRGAAAAPVLVVAFSKTKEGATSAAARGFPLRFAEVFASDEATLTPLNSADFASTLFAVQAKAEFIRRRSGSSGDFNPADAIIITQDALRSRLGDFLEPSREGETAPDLFPLHDQGQTTWLEEKWAEDPAATLNQPLTAVASYFGTSIASYFGLLEDLTTSLFPLAVVGLGLYFYQRHVDSIDNAPTVAFAVLTALWATIATKRWKRNQSARAFEWGLDPRVAVESIVGGAGGWAGLARFAFITVPVMALCILTVGLFIAAVERVRSMSDSLLKLPLSSIFAVVEEDQSVVSSSFFGLFERRSTVLHRQAIISPTAHLLLLPSAITGPDNHTSLTTNTTSASTITGFPMLDQSLAVVDEVVASRLLHSVARLFLGFYLSLDQAESSWKMTTDAALPWLASFILKQLPTIFFLVGVGILDAVNSHIAVLLTKLEGHKSKDDYESSLIGKQALLIFFDNFSSLLYLAFVRQDLNLLRSTLLFILGVKAVISNVQEVVLPLLQGEVALIFSKVKSRPLPPAPAPATVAGVTTTTTAGESEHRRLSSHDVSAIAAEMKLDSGVAVAASPSTGTTTTAPTTTAPTTTVTAEEKGHLRAVVGSLLSPSRTRPLEGTTALEAVSSRHFLTDHLNVAQVEATLPAYNPTDDVMELFLQFAHVSLFSSLLPIAPGLAFLNNLVEVHSDSFKLLRVHRRPLVQEKKATLGSSWIFAFDCLGYVGLAVNLGIVYISLVTDQGGLSGEGGRSQPSVGSSQQLATFLGLVLLEHALVFLKVLFDRFVPDSAQVAVAGPSGGSPKLQLALAGTFPTIETTPTTAAPTATTTATSVDGSRN